MTTYFVLWLYVGTPWLFAGVPQTAGWGAVAILADADACWTALANTGLPAWCAPAGVEPHPVSSTLPTAIPYTGQEGA